MKKNLVFLLLCTASIGVSDPPVRSEPITMVFSETDVSQVLKALSVRTGSSVIYAAGKDKLAISINVTVNTAEEAIRSVASAAGLVYRKVDKLFIVAPPAGLRQALEPYDFPATFSITSDRGTEIAAKLQDALPYSVFKAEAGRIAMNGLPADIQSASRLVTEFNSEAEASKTATEVVMLHTGQAANIVPLIQSLYPDVKVSGTAKPDPTDPKDAPSAIGLTGPIGQVHLALHTIQQLDTGRGTGDNPVVFKICPLKYMNGNSVVDLLKQAAPEVQVFTGPEAIIPNRAMFNPLSASLGTGTSGTSFFGGSGGGGTGTTGSTTGSTQGQGVSPTKPGDRATAVVLKGRQSEVDGAIHLIDQLDTKPKQVFVEVNVIETSPEEDEQLGVAYNWSPLGFVESAAGTILGSDPGGTTATSIPGGTRPLGLGQFSRTPLNFLATISAMVTHKSAKILARPSVEVVDNGQASVFIGDTIRAEITTAGALGATNTVIDEFPVGIILLIAPRVNADGNITLHVNPVVSTVTSIDASNIPQTSVREAETTTIVKSGETVVLGGLIQDQDIKTVQEVPFLSKLPIIGELFKYHTRSHKKSDIIVSITPHVLNEPEVAKK